MKIKNIEFDEKTLVTFNCDRKTFNTTLKYNCVKWWIDLSFKIPDDFNFLTEESKTLEYTEFDLKGIDELDNYIEYLKTELNAIVEKNKSK